MPYTPVVALWIQHIDQGRNGAELECRKHRDYIFDRVGSEDEHPIALPDAK